ncbi:MAG: PEP-CTERM sorting domain-containing protein [Bryobacterales bacterium]|nr:PEP-CTERM sorting domain-containing protein [Bryobacterales bacterium]
MEAYLTDQVGAGTTQAANELSPSVTVPFAAGHSGLLTLYTGLSLGPGNYFVTVTPAATHGTLAYIGEVNLPTPTLDTGVAILGYGIDIDSPSSYIPDMPTPWIFSAWAFEVTGDPVVDGVPEPSGLLLMGSGLAALLYRVRRG